VLPGLSSPSVDEAIEQPAKVVKIRLILPMIKSIMIFEVYIKPIADYLLKLYYICY